MQDLLSAEPEAWRTRGPSSASHSGLQSSGKAELTGHRAGKSPVSPVIPPSFPVGRASSERLRIWPHNKAARRQKPGWELDPQWSERNPSSSPGSLPGISLAPPERKRHQKSPGPEQAPSGCIPSISNQGN